jgi:imidazoleglycerol-phosphate dehydratase
VPLGYLIFVSINKLAPINMSTVDLTQFLHSLAGVDASSFAGVVDSLPQADLAKLRANLATLLSAVDSRTPTRAREATVERKTKETTIAVHVSLDGDGSSTINTGIGFLDHMFTALAKHSLININMTCAGDLHVDDHHTTEDCALALGQAIDKALGDRAGIARYGFAYAPLDEALARAVVDVSGRPSSTIDLQLKRERVGQLSTEMITHAFQSLATTAHLTLHVDVLKVCKAQLQLFVFHL